MQYQANRFLPRAVMVGGTRQSNNCLDPNLKERYHALRRKQTNQTVGRNNFQNLSSDQPPNILKLQQFTIMDKFGKPKTISAWVDQTNLVSVERAGSPKKTSQLVAC